MSWASALVAGWAGFVATSIPLTPLFTFIMIVALIVVLLVGVLVTIVIWRFRARPGAPPPRQDFGNRRLEIAWTVAPAAIVLLVFGLTLGAMRSPLTPGAGLPPGQQPEIEVIGRQWWWEIRYPQSGVVTANVLHLPVGRPVLVSLTAEVVQHNFWVPELGQKMDMYPGKVNHLWLQAPASGTYHGACAEFCGVQHAWMRILAIAQSEAEYTAWLADQQRRPVGPVTPLAERGRTLFGQYACGTCHAIGGTEWQANAGPNLTHFGSRPTISAGVLENTPENLARYLRNPQEVKPGIYMPNYRLNDEEIAALVAYLEGLR